MTSADDLFKQSSDNIQRLGLKEIPFTESPIDLNSDTLDRVFTGRKKNWDGCLICSKVASVVGFWFPVV